MLVATTPYELPERHDPMMRCRKSITASSDVESHLDIPNKCRTGMPTRYYTEPSGVYEKGTGPSLVTLDSWSNETSAII